MAAAMLSGTAPAIVDAPASPTTDGRMHAAALQEQAADTVITINDVVVTATRTYVNRNNIPLSISVVRRDEIEQSSESALLPVLSQHVPGLFVTQRGVTGFGISEGSAGAVNIRGVGQGNKVLMLFDGQPQWAGLFGHHLPDSYIASDVERVEVIRGPGSLIYGSNAMGGVVNILTRQQLEEGVTLQARLMYGSFNTQKYMFNNGFRKGRWSTFVSINHDRTDGHRPNSEFRITNGFAKVGYKISDHWDAMADFSLAGYDAANPGMVSNPIFDNTVDVLRGTASLSLKNNFGKISGGIQLFYNFGDHEINDGYYRGETPRDYLFHSKDHNYGVLAYESFSFFTRNTFTVGLDYKNWGGRAWNDFLDARPDARIIDKSVNETAGYFIMQQGVGSKVNLSGGVRLEHNSVFGQAWIPQAGLTYNPFAGTSLKASFSKGFRSPSIRELYMFLSANPNLKPENMLNYEVSVGQEFLQGKLFAEATAFYIDGKDMIQVIRTDGRPLNVNTGKFTNKGIELEASYRVLKNLFVSTNYSYLHTDKPLIAAPEHQLFLTVTYRPGRFSFNLNMQYIGGLNLTEAVPLIRESYTLLNARASYRLGRKNGNGLDLFIKGENLTDRGYSINNGFPMPGITIMAGVDIPLVLKK